MEKETKKFIEWIYEWSTATRLSLCSRPTNTRNERFFLYEILEQELLA